ncbi:MAG: hypothetical protein DI556_18630 [Rhodovulum sulfidophilum]|uniref:YjiS-like domain-containing protein n=1 Tax=Rhodovulum sulfidophilum TaxID=35806 RepID=A0A2W5N8B0_RHOSU|nr:MAG: hypothetical protein DI556_18630 [Rhodovulum sulfidophilum]
MSVYEIETNTRAVPLGSVATLRIVNLVERVCDAYVAWRNVRATERALAKLSESQLNDIGLRRAHISAVAMDLARR